MGMKKCECLKFSFLGITSLLLLFLLYSLVGKIPEMIKAVIIFFERSLSFLTQCPLLRFLSEAVEKTYIKLKLILKTFFFVLLTRTQRMYTRQVSSMIHSARPIVTPVAIIIFCCFVFIDLKRGDGRTYGQYVRKQ